MNKETDKKYKSNYKERYRPQFHFSPQKYWMNDPNGLVYFDGEYHLFYQHNPFENKWGHMSWGHAVSNDLVYWKHLPVALAEENNIMIFSGCVVADTKKTSPFAEEGKIPLVAIYTGHNIKTGNQSQCLAFSTDKGRKWTKYEHNPVLDIASTSFRDPKVFWYEPESKWIMIVALSDERKVQLYCSENLKEWSWLSAFGPAAAVDGVWECPDLFSLAVDNNSEQMKWILKVDLASGAQYGGSGGQYFIGDFDGKQFKQDEQIPAENNINWIDFGKDFYAATSFANMQDNRRVWIAWLANWQYAERVPTDPWKNICSIPRELSLVTIDGQIKLIQQPVRELRKLRHISYSLQNIKLKQSIPIEKVFNLSKTLEIEVEFEMDNNSLSEFGFEFFHDKKGKNTVGYNCKKKELFINREKSALTDIQSGFLQTHFVTLSPKNKSISMHIFLDSCSVEVFAHNGQVILTDLIFPAGKNFVHNLYVKNGPVTLKNLKVWQLKSIWNSGPM